MYNIIFAALTCTTNATFAHALNRLARAQKYLHVHTKKLARGLKVSKVMEFNDLSCHDLGEYLKDRGIHEDVIAVFNANRICGEAFMELREDDLREMLPVIGDRVRIRKLLDSLQQVKLHLLCHI